MFWSSVDLTGNQTAAYANRDRRRFWSSVDLTGNQTAVGRRIKGRGFGAVSI